ncbi:MAG TPA: hypothetical protein VE091_06965 [Gemmatimonadales bacterium]|nr:hypothetical protein [Gemmatimonadales bacterium]
MDTSLREARLRQEYDKLYPGLTPGLWLPAAEVAEHIVDMVRHERGRFGLQGRLVADDHFDFRGGGTADRRTPNERREDRGEPTG